MKKKLLTIILALCLTPTLPPVIAPAADMPRPAIAPASAIPAKVYDTLTPKQKYLYDALKVQINQIANGEKTSTEFTIYMDDYGLPSDDKDYISVLDALYADLPYGLYWYEGSDDINIVEGGDAVISFQFPVSRDYSVNGKRNTYVTAPPQIAVARAAAANARAVVTENAGKSDIEKLRAYKNYICRQVSYDTALYANTTGEFLNPSQLINVFDNDPHTNALCEGYAKAFQYLCDLSTFKSRATCYRASSSMHAWNIVRMDGYNYLADVTNCDENAFGAFIIGPDGALQKAAAFGDLLFMLNCGGPYGKAPNKNLFMLGSVENGYTVIRETVSDTDDSLISTYYGGNVTYKYDDLTKRLYPDEILSLNVPDQPLTLRYLGSFSKDYWEIGAGISPIQPAVGGGSGADYAFMVKNGEWPQGLTLNPVTGVISGTPAVLSPGLHRITATISVEDSAGNAADGAVTFPPIKYKTICDPPAGLTAVYGQKLSDIQLVNPEGNTEGAWSWKDPDADVGDAGEHNALARFTPASADYGHPSFIPLSYTVAAAIPATGALDGSARIIGAAKFGETLTIDTSSIIGNADASSLRYQWKRDTFDISGATAETYTLVATDIGKTISCVITSAAETGVITTPATAAVVVQADVNGDNKLTRADLLRLAKYFSGYDVTIDKTAADVTGDGKLTRVDLLRLAKYFSGYDVKLGK